MGSQGQPGAGLDVSIIGGGIAGVTLALGLLARGIIPIVYERAESFREVGAGIGFTPNSERAMKVLDPRIHAAFKRVTVQNGTDWFMWMDGFSRKDDEMQSDEDNLIHKMYLGERGFEGCHRADFLEELIKMMPKDTIRFRKSLDSYNDPGDDGRVRLRFTDGSTVDTDVGMARCRNDPEKNLTNKPVYG
ncbi:MAG: hypothetical protein Q9183_005484 [Haloplaca sp. 2 TL-2023]